MSDHHHNPHQALRNHPLERKSRQSTQPPRRRGYDDLDEIRVKELLLKRLRKVVKAKEISQTAIVARAAAYDRCIGLSQPDLSRILRGHIDGVSVWRLIRILNALGEDIRIVTSPSLAGRSIVEVVEKPRWP